MITEIEVLERVDEYSLYSFYLGFEFVINEGYSSPIREGDVNSSFGVYRRKLRTSFHLTELMWKDAAYKGKNFGDIFDLVQIIFTEVTNRDEAIYKVAADSGLVPGFTTTRSIPLKQVKEKDPSYITIRSRPFSLKDLAYWQIFGVTLPTLERYQCKAVDFYWLTKQQKVPFRGMQTYSYQVKDKYQLYTPYSDNKKYKFTTDWDESCVPGAIQLKKYKKLVITKAYKDLMTIAEVQDQLGVDVLAVRGENIVLPQHVIQKCSEVYEEVFTLFDNDDKTSAHKYPFKDRIIPKITGQKDPSDYRKAFGPDAFIHLLNKLLC